MAAELGLSAAQISSVVDSLRQRRAIVHQRAPEDRRRQIWQLTPSGLELIEQIVAHLAYLNGPQRASDKPDMHVSPEAA
jgi:DNA-binding MarR family transcriptional regulator